MKRHAMTAGIVASLLACGGDMPVADEYGEVSLGAYGSEFDDSVEVTAVRVRLYGVNGNPWPGLELAAGRGANGRWSARIDQVPVGDVAFHAVALDAAGTIVYETAAPDPVARVAARTTTELTLVLQRKGGAAPYANGAPYISSVLGSQSQIDPGTLVHLSATYVDPDGPGDIASVRWSGPGTFSAPAAAQTDWTPPPIDGDYVLRFTVTDRKLQAASVELTMHVDRRFAKGAVSIWVLFNDSPVVDGINAHDAKVLGAGGSAPEVVDLTAIASDADGDFLTYAWAEANGCDGSFVGATDGATARFAALAGAIDCDFVVTVRDFDPADHTRARGGVNIGTVHVAMGPPVLIVAPSFHLLTAAPVPAFPGGSATIQVVAVDSQSHWPGAPASWALSWSEDAGGTLVLTDSSYAVDGTATYTVPDVCPGQWAGTTWTVTVRVTVEDVVTLATASAAFALDVDCP